MTVKFSTQKSTVLPRIPASITDAATRGFLEDILKHLDRLNRDVRGDFDKIVAGDAALDHGLMFGLADDDHTQYFNTTRGDARFSQLGHDHASAYAALSHAHDDRYFTESESDLRYSLLGHNHDLSYAAIAHNHDLLYSAIGHDHDSDYSAIGHDHDSDYSNIAHDHDDDYSLLGHEHNGLYMTIPAFETYNLVYQSSHGYTPSAIRTCTLSTNRAAIYMYSTNKLMCYEFSEIGYSLVGNALTLNSGPISLNGMCAITDSDIALIIIVGADVILRKYNFDGSDWAQVGSDTILPNLSNLASVNDTDIIVSDVSDHELSCYRFNGTTFDLVGNSLSVSECYYCVKLTETDFAVLTNGDPQYLVCYHFDGTDFSKIGNEKEILSGTNNGFLTSLSAIDVAFRNSSMEVDVYRFNGVDWALSSSVMSIGSYSPFNMTGINGTDIICMEITNFSYYRFCSLPDSGIGMFDNAAGNVSISAHGYCPKAPNDVTKFLRGDASWNVPPSVSTSAPGYAPTAPNDNALYLDGIGGYSFPKTKEVPITISNATGDSVNDITFSAGWVYDSTGAYKMALASAMTKRSDADYAAGDGNGGGNLSGSGWFHCYVIRKDSDGTIDCCFNTVPAGHTYYRHVGWIYHTDAAGITQFIQDGNRFLLSVPVRSYTANNPGTSAVLVTMLCPPSMRALTHVNIDFAAITAAYLFGLVTSPLQADSAPSSSLFNIPVRSTNGRYGNYFGEVLADSSSRIRYRLDFSSASVDVNVFTNGWIDTLLK